ncbi:DUF1294 domain-containing protein [Bacillus sp. N9]
MLLISYSILINLIGLRLMKKDKRNAQKGKRRIPENTLWMTAMIGGALGMTVGMQTYRHKTKHVTFFIGLPLLAIIDVFLFISLFMRLS